MKSFLHAVYKSTFWTLWWTIGSVALADPDLDVWVFNFVASILVTVAVVISLGWMLLILGTWLYIYCQAAEDSNQESAKQGKHA